MRLRGVGEDEKGDDDGQLEGRFRRGGVCLPKTHWRGGRVHVDTLIMHADRTIAGEGGVRAVLFRGRWAQGELEKARGARRNLVEPKAARRCDTRGQRNTRTRGKDGIRA